MPAVRLSWPFPAPRSAPVREGLAVAQALGLGGRLGAWRGVSGRRYIVSTIALDRLPELGAAVFIAVGRDGAGRPYIAAIAGGEAGDAMDDPKFRSADVIDVHLLADSQAERERIVADLSETNDRSGPFGVAQGVGERN